MKVLIFVVLTLILSFSLTSVINAQSQQSQTDKIFLKSRQFVPEKKSWVENAKFQMVSISTNNIHIIIQFDHILSTEEKEEFEKNGVKLLDYIPDKAWFASISTSQLSQLYPQSSVTFFDYIKPEDKIEPIILSSGVSSWSKNEDGTVNLMALFFSDVTNEESKKIIEKYGSIVNEPGIGNTWIVRIPETSIKSLAGEDIVKWIENSPAPRRTFNNESRAVIGVTTVQASPYGLNGTNVVIVEWDGGWVDTTHDDLQGRVTVNDSVGSVIDHATHVAGTAIGNGTLSGSLQRGMAPNTTLISYEWWDDQTEFNTEYNFAINSHNAVISQNSWGVGASPVNTANCVALLGNYDSSNVWIDNATRGSLGKPITIVWAGGNERGTGSIYCGSVGFITYNTTPPYGTSKNTITVGAIDKTEVMSSFSSWGPTDDERIKPDVVAVGVSVNSTIPTDNYTTSSGTSMAAPAVSGAIALLYQDYRSIHQNSNPLPSTIKALLIHTAKDLNNTGPDFTTGYGLVNATASVDKIREDNTSEVIIEDNITANGQNKTYRISVSSQSSFKLTLVWDDYPGSASVSKQLVNDLDLVVLNSTNDRFFPWTLNASNLGQNATQDRRDDTNNMEQVYVSSPSSGIWTIAINGTSIPQPNQSFSLISSIPVIRDITKPIITIEFPSNRTYNTQTIHFNITVDEALANASVSLDNQPNRTLTNDSVTHYYNITFPSISEGFHNATFYANDTSGNINSTTIYFTIDITKPNIQIQRPENTTYTTNVNLPLNFTVNEATSWCGYSLDNGNNVTISNCLNTTFNVSIEGSHNIKIFANDTVDNMNVSDTRFFTIDLPPRVLTDTEINITRVNRGQAWQASAKWSEPVNFSYIEYNITNSLLNISTQNITSNWTNHTNSTANEWLLGIHAVRFYINDSSNNWNYSSQATFELWGWSEINQSIIPSSVNEDTYQLLLCRVRDANTTSPIANYNVTFYDNSTVRPFLGSNLTNGTGWSNITISWDTPVAYEIRCNITDSSTAFYNVSSAANISILTVNDTTPPQYSNPRNTSAVFNQSFQANATWTDNVNISAVVLETNFTGSSANYTVADRSGNEYYFTILYGNHTVNKTITYRWHANDTSNLWNSTSQLNYTVGKSSTQTRLFLNGTEGNKNYQKGSISNITAMLNVTGKNVTIVGNFSGNITLATLSNGTSPQQNLTNTTNLNISVYNVTAYFLGDENYTASSINYSMNVLKLDGESCSAASECFGSYCNSGICASSAPPSSTTSSDGGGGGGTTTTEKKTEVKVSTTLTNITIPSIASGKSENVSITNFAVREVFIEVKNTVNNVKISVEKIAAKPTEVTTPSGIVSHYLKIDKQNITDNDINKTKIKFAIEKAWITDNDINESTIALQRYASNQWNKLTTIKISESQTEILYQAESSGLSVFAVTGELKFGLTCPTCPSPENWTACINNTQTRTNYKCSAETNYNCQTYNETRSCGIEEGKKGLSMKWIVIIVPIVAMIFASIFFWKKSKKRWEKLYKKYKF